MKTALVIRHVAFEDLGSFAVPLQAQKYHIRYVEAGVEDIARLQILDPELLIVLGGPISVNDTRDYPFLDDELRLLERRLSQNQPTLGICLGSQLIARALGSRVYPGSYKEIGWAPLRLTAAGESSCLRFLAPDTYVLHWHGDTFDLPANAVRLASTDVYENQGFTWGNTVLALQFHPEVTVAGLERWFIGHTGEITATPQISVTQLRADSTHWGPILEKKGPRCLEAWLQAL